MPLKSQVTSCGTASANSYLKVYSVDMMGGKKTMEEREKKVLWLVLSHRAELWLTLKCSMDKVIIYLEVKKLFNF